ncbi:MAG: response regulator, partial [Clostridia bacterium]|nr:response regulator [Clostridia bacterium]
MAYTVLIADDEAEIRELLRLYLENENYTVLEAADGQEALRLFRGQHVDLCILDVMMPGMDGFHVLRELRKVSNVPVLMLSARDRDEDKILGLNLGADDYLAKPFNPLEAAARVNSAIRRFHSLGAEISSAGGDPLSGTGKENRSGLLSEKLCVRDLELDGESCTLTRAGE